MKILLLAVLLAVSQASAPVPRQATDNAAGSSQHIKQQSDDKQNPSPGSVRPIVQNRASANVDKDNGETPAKTDTQETIFITESAAMPIKDRWNKAYVIFTGLLVIIASLGVSAAIKTLREIKQQVEEMEQQRIVMGGQLETMKGQLGEMKQTREIETKTLLLQYRPKIIIRDARASDFNVAELGQPAKGKVHFTIINSGGSAAHIVEGTVAAWSADVPDGIVKISYGEDFLIAEFTLEPGQDRSFDRILNAGVTNDLQWANYHAGDRTEPTKAIYLVGTIKYLDDLKIPRRTGFFRVYDPKTGKFVPSKNSDEEYAD